MRPSLVPSFLQACWRSGTHGRVPFLHGSPGIGKSDLVRQAAVRMWGERADVAKMKLSAFDTAETFVREFRAILRDPVDLRGLPRINDEGETVYTKPDVLAGLDTEDSGVRVVFLDELPSAPKLVQAACYELILDRRVGGWKLPEHVRLVAAGNLSTDRAVHTEMPTPLKSRMVHVTVEVSVEDWLRWAEWFGIHPDVVSFVKYNPALLHVFDASALARSGDHTFPCPRTYHILSDLMYAEPDEAIEREMYEGTVGRAVTGQFMTHVQLRRSLPPLETLVASPETAEIPGQASIRYGLALAIAGLVNERTVQAGYTYCRRLGAEYLTAYMRAAVRRDADLRRTRTYQTWAAENADVLL